jgi:malate dehydrogenase (quinone)
VKEWYDIRENPDVILIGAGIMSATLAMMLKELEPQLTIAIFERLPEAARESSDAWNNAGTGHSAFCELNYTPQRGQGKVDCTKAVKIAGQFEASRQFWAHLIEKGYLHSPEKFIRQVPHMSFVWGEENVAFLKKRFAQLKKHPLFQGMKFTTKPAEIAKWLPLVTDGRPRTEKIAATRIDCGTDVNFGNLTRALFTYLDNRAGVTIYYNHEVSDIERHANGHWQLDVRNLMRKKKLRFESNFVFVGAGGGALPLLEKSDLAEAKGYGGFPVSGQWLRCKNQKIIGAHHAKVYGKASVGTPPMSVPHLDTRFIDGKKELLFGPYAGFSTKFLKKGSYLDLMKSLEFTNLIPMISAGLHNVSLTKYLIKQATQSHDERMDALREFMPTARNEDWELLVAGQRVQVIRADHEQGGVLEFGTEIIAAHDSSLVAILGASPGASTSVTIALDILDRCFESKMKSREWKTRLRQMIPTYGTQYQKDAAKVRQVRNRTARILKL